MKKICLIISYDGTDYSGWQRQDNALGIQEVIENLLAEVTGEKITLKVAGRTDAGVHANAQVADFITNSSVPPHKYIYPLNNFLPHDIRIMKSFEVTEDFSSRFSALGKHYRYSIYLGEMMPAKLTRYYSLYSYKPDLEKIQKAANVLIGTHDFKAFEGPYAQMRTSVRTVNDIKITQAGKRIYFDIYGEAFLKNMVRIMVGTILKANENKITPEEIEELFVTRDRTKAGITMPANGLTLEEVYYDWEKYIINQND